MKDVAELAGVSVSAVSMALADSPQIGDDTKRRVRDICRDVGYPLRRSSQRRQRNGSPKRFGFTSLEMNLQDEGLAALLQELAERASAEKIRLELSATPQEANPADKLDQIKRMAGELDGLLISGICAVESLEELQSSGLPLVMLGHLHEEEEPALVMPHRISTVACDSWQMGRLATNYLLQRGHRRIACFSERTPRGMYAWRWLMGYRAALLENGITPRDAWVHVNGKAFTGGGEAARAFAALDEVPTAFVCPDVRTGASFMDAARDLALEPSPETMVLGGHRDVAQRYELQHFPLIDEHAASIATCALDLLQRKIDGEISGYPSIVVPFVTYNLG